MTKKVFTPIRVGNMTLDHRFAMAPMTRSRATFEGVQTPLAAEYYGQRAADMGLVITEAVQPSLQAQGNNNTPGIYTPEQVAAWQSVTKAVHDNGGYLFMQIQHAGRLTHPENAAPRPAAIAPSAVAPEGQIFTPNGPRDVPVPNEATKADLENVVAEFRLAARRAIDAGADGVEIHGGHSFLLHQFFGETSNVRQDEYGGSIENRIRFVLEVVAAVVDEIGADKTAIRLSPFHSRSTIDEGENGTALYVLLMEKLNDMKLAYVHLVLQEATALLTTLREKFIGPLVVNFEGQPLDMRLEAVESGLVDMLTIGTLSLANPDFVARVKADAPFNEPDFSTTFGRGAQGYTDYPTLG
ncbi:MAG TPA: alkene reductase [Lactobacillaceae bacterium]|jgi:2,4-dienoyl-CoA reductase-like NADH-dependent reductase (Old Yellow Enzyme family)